MDKVLVSLLEKALPRCSLFYGSSIDFSLARHLKEFYNLSEVDYFERDKLLVKDAATIKRLCSVSAEGNFKLIVVSLKNASTSAINDLLILLEDVPDHVRFMFLADRRVLPTIESRCAIYELGKVAEREYSSNAQYVVEALETDNAVLLQELIKSLDGRTAHQVAKILGDKAVSSPGARELLKLASTFNYSSLNLCFKAFLPNFLGRI